MAEPIPAQKAPYPVEAVAGQQVFWCACGRSKTQPFCDGSHKAVGLKPMAFTPPASEKVWLCGCKQTKTKPFCDGTHKTLL
ncbi:MAG: CDGSH iron-sulfur domain-containing protein [Pseudomonadota bacterium]